MSQTQFNLDNGTTVDVEQDTLAYPYARVTLTTPGAGATGFSIQQSVASNILSNSSLQPADRLKALQEFPFRLPENLRQVFQSSNADQWRNLATVQARMALSTASTVDPSATPPFFPPNAAANATPVGQMLPPNQSNNASVNNVTPQTQNHAIAGPESGTALQSASLFSKSDIFGIGAIVLAIAAGAVLFMFVARK